MPTPTPADLAALHRTPLTARPVQAAVPRLDRLATPLPVQGGATAGAPLRRQWEASIQHSTLHPHARLVALTVASYAVWSPGAVVLPDVEIGVPRLSKASRLEQGQVRLSLHRLGEGGWIQRVPAQSGHEASVIRLLLPTTPARE